MVVIFCYKGFDGLCGAVLVGVKSLDIYGWISVSLFVVDRCFCHLDIVTLK
jgi:hypothetical protein